MMLWMTSYHRHEPWAMVQQPRALAALRRMWVDPPGYFCRQRGLTDVKFAFTNYGVSLGLQACDEMADRVAQLNRFFAEYRSGDEYDTEAITHVMHCTSLFPGLFIGANVRPSVDV